MPNENKLVGVDPRELLKLDNPDLRAALEAMLPKPTHPEHMLGLWAQHPEYGSVLVTYDHPDKGGDVIVAVRMTEHSGGAAWKAVHVSELTFPEQTTRPEDVTPGEAWLVDANDGRSPYTRVAALKDGLGEWRTAEDETHEGRYWMDGEVTLIAPLTPQPSLSPEYVETEKEYEALPTGSIVAQRASLPWSKSGEDNWIETVTFGQAPCKSSEIAGVRRRVLRRGLRHE